MRRVGDDHFVACHHPLVEPVDDGAAVAVAAPGSSADDAVAAGNAPTV
jgi:hypothetical protein